MLTRARVALDLVVPTWADEPIHFVTRQAVQFLGAAKEGVRPWAHSMDVDPVTFFGACGDVVRNVSPNPTLARDGADVHLIEITRLLTGQ